MGAPIASVMLKEEIAQGAILAKEVMIRATAITVRVIRGNCAGTRTQHLAGIVPSTLLWIVATEKEHVTMGLVSRRQ